MPRLKGKARKHNTTTTESSAPSLSASTNPSNASNPETSCTTTLPFTFEQAISDPAKYRELVTPAIWEEHVNLPNMKEMYSSDTAVSFNGDGRRWRATLVEDSWDNFFSQGRKIPRMHYRVAEIILGDRGWFFERMWKASSIEHRSNTILLALNTTFRKIGPPGLIWRWWCPDITIESMVEKGGLLPLVRYIARSGRIHKGRDYHPVISPDFDRTNGTKRNATIDESIPFDRAVRHMQILTEQSRDYFIVLFVLLVLFEHFDPKQLFPNGFDSLLALAHDKPRLEVTNARDWMLAGHLDSRDKQYMFDLQEACGVTDRQEEMHRIVDELHKEKEAKWGCETCFRYPEQVPELVKSGRKKLLWCSGCLKIERRIGYCGDDCCRKDWKDGHKIMCGKSVHQIDFRHGQLPPPSEPPLSLSLQWHLYRKDLPEDLPRSYVFRRQIGESSFDAKSGVVRTEGARTTENLNPAVHSLLLAAVQARDKAYIRLFVTFAAIASEAPFEWEEPWKQAIAQQASEEWDLDYDEVYGWLAKEAVDEMERVWKRP